MSAPLVYVGSYTGKGTPFFVRVPFRLRRYWIVIKGDTTQHACWTSPTVWYRRSSHFAALGSEFDEIGGVEASGFWVLTDAVTNSAGVTYHYLVIDDNATGAVIPFSWMGNAVSGRQIELPVSRAVKYGLFKRDSTELAIHMTPSLAQGVLENGGSDSQGVLGLTAAGLLTVGNSARINESTAILGEGVEALLLCDHPSVHVTAYIGTGVARTIATPFTPAACFVIPNEAVTGSTGTHMGLSTLGSDCLPLSNVAKQSGRITALDASGVALGTHASVNESGRSYTLVALKANTTQGIRDRPLNSARKGIRLPVNGTSMIECGNSDTLRFAGAMSIEWYGRIPGGSGVTNAATGAPLPLLMRTWNGSGGAATRPTASWGLETCMNSPNHAAGGFGTVLRVVVNDWHDIASADSDCRLTPWNTGVALTQNQDHHILVTHDGSGKWRVYLDGFCVKERNTDMRSLNAAYPNIDSGAGHKTGIDVRYGSSGGTAVGKFPLVFYFGAVWDRELTASEVGLCYRARVLRQSVDAPTPTEYWDATSASGSSLPAGINAANNGTITSGVIFNR